VLRARGGRAAAARARAAALAPRGVLLRGAAQREDERVQYAEGVYGDEFALAGKVALYASRVDECRVGDEVVIPQEGDFYGGWITSNITGPFKGAPGTLGW
jgi:hypothetical protein